MATSHCVGNIIHNDCEKIIIGEYVELSLATTLFFPFSLQRELRIKFWPWLTSTHVIVCVCVHVCPCVSRCVPLIHTLNVKGTGQFWCSTISKSSGEPRHGLEIAFKAFLVMIGTTEDNFEGVPLGFELIVSAHQCRRKAAARRALHNRKGTPRPQPPPHRQAYMHKHISTLH